MGAARAVLGGAVAERRGAGARARRRPAAGAAGGRARRPGGAGAPLAPYWAVLWRSGVALARELDGAALRGRRVVELGCGLAVPSIAAARSGATVLATDGSPEALELAERNARENGVSIETTRVDW